MRKSRYKPFQKGPSVKKKWQPPPSQLRALQSHAKMIIGGQCLVKLADTLEQLMALPLEICLQAPLIPAAGKSNTAINEDLTQQVYYLKSTHPITEFLWLYRQIDLEEMIYTYRINTLPPYCHLLLKAAPDTDLRQALNNAYQCIEGEYMYALSASLRRVLSDFMITLYQERSCCWFKAINKAYYRAEYDNFKSYTAYLKALFRKYARLLVIRVDLGYYQFVQTPYKQFMEDVDTFLKKIPFHPVFQHKVGYIWKLEYGQQKGFHVHLLLLYDGSKRRADYHIAKKIGELWQGMAPHRCLYFNCHEKTYQARYPINCLGLVTRHNEDIIKHLQNKVIDYFTKTDPYIKLFNQNTHKLSDRGQLPKPKAKTKNYSDKNKLTATNDHD